MSGWWRYDPVSAIAMTRFERFAGSVAVVTGAAEGIGRGVAQRFLSEGARVVLADIDQTTLTATLDALGDDPRSRAVAVHADASRPPDVAAIFDAARTTFGGLDIVVNNAGIAHGRDAERHFLDTDEAMWDRLVAVNLKSVYLCAAHASRIMIEQRRGSIINVSSVGATRAHRHRVAYDATKGAIEAATRALALDLAPFGIRVNAVAPGVISVARRSAVGRPVRPADVVPVGREGSPGDVAAATAFLASDDASYITGVCLPVDGGLLAQLRSPMVDLHPSPENDREPTS